MRVTHVSCYVDPLGRSPRELLEKWPTLTDVAAAASDDEVDVAVVQAASQSELIVYNGVPCHFVRDYRRSVRAPGRLLASGRPRSLTAKVVELAPDLVHLHGLSFTRQAEFVARALPDTPVLMQDHADRPPQRSPFGFPRMARGIAALCSTSRDQVAPFFEAGVFHPRLRVYEILESSSRFTPGDRAAARAETGLYGDPCLICVGRLAPIKDPLTVLDAFSQAIAQLPDPHLWCFYTEAPLYPDVQRRLDREPALGQRVHLQGNVPHGQIEEVFRAADFLMLGSRFEGSAYSVIESIACGTPPIVTDIPALRRVTGNGAIGALVPPGDAATMADALVTWSQRDRESLRQRVRAHFERELSFDIIGRDLRAAYRELVGPG